MSDIRILKEQLLKTKRGALLIDEAGEKFISCTPERPAYFTNRPAYEHPLQDRLPEGAFLPPDASIPVLADDDILNVFWEQNAWEDLPRFNEAGAHRKYLIDPSNCTVGVLTAGGNAPGLDAIVDSLVKRQFFLGTEYCKKNNKRLNPDGYPPELKFYGIIGGYQGLEKIFSPLERDWKMELHPRITDPWVTRGCSSLHALRTNPMNLKEEAEKKEFDDFIVKLAMNVRKLRLDILYAIGGNGTMLVAQALGKKLMEAPDTPCLVVSGPKTMDNDINFTDVTFGFRTTVDNAIKFLRDFHREAETLERVGIAELYGADSGFVALHAAYASGEADYVLIPEKMGTDVECELQNAIRCIDERARKNGHALLVVAEGATTRAYSAINRNAGGVKGFEHGKKVEQEIAFTALVEYVRKHIKASVFFSQPRHLIRATPPNGFDIDLCKYTGKLMVDTALSGYTCCAVHLWQGKYVLVPLKTAVAKLKRVDTSGYYFISMWEKYQLARSTDAVR